MAENIKDVSKMTEAEVQAEIDKVILSTDVNDLTEDEIDRRIELEEMKAGGSTPAPTPGASETDFKNWQLPLLGSLVGGIALGGVTGGVGSVPGAVLGAATGKTTENLLRTYLSPNTQPVSQLEAIAGPGIEGAMGGASELFGLGVNKGVSALAKTKAGQAIGKGASSAFRGATNIVGNALGMSPTEAQYFIGNYPEYLKQAGMSGKEAFKYANELRAKFNEQIKKGKQAQNKILNQVRTEAQQTPISISSLDRIQGNLRGFLNNMPKGEVLGDEAKIIQNEVDLIERMKTRKLTPEQTQMLADYDTKLNAYLDAGGDPSQASFEAYLADQQRSVMQPELVRTGDAIVRGNLGEAISSPGKQIKTGVDAVTAPSPQYPLDIAPQYPGPRPEIEGQPELSMNELLGLQERLNLLIQSEFGKKLGFTKGAVSDKAIKEGSAATYDVISDLAQTSMPFLKKRIEANKVLSEMRESAKPVPAKMFEKNQPITPILSLSKETPEGVANRENMSRLNELSGYGPAFSDMLDYSSAANAKKALDAFGAKQYATRAALGIGAGAGVGGLTGRADGSRNVAEEAMYLGLLGGTLGTLINPKLGAMGLRNIPKASQWLNYAVPRTGANLGAQEIKNYLGTNYEGFDYGN